MPSRRVYAADALLVAAFALAQVAAVVVWGGRAGRDAGALAADLATLVLLPWLVWNWVMAFVTLQHHTHPRVKWFDDEREWSFFAAQVGGTVHMRFPWLIEKAFQNIFDHTAHHVDKGVPLFALPKVPAGGTAGCVLPMR